MKKRIIALFAMLALFTMAIAAYSYTQQTITAGDKTCCNKKDGESCPMKGKGHDEKGEHAGMSCCKKHEGAQAGHSCDCCGDSCPMKKGEGANTSEHNCENCDCCKEKPKTSE